MVAAQIASVTQAINDPWQRLRRPFPKTLAASDGRGTIGQLPDPGKEQNAAQPRHSRCSVRRRLVNALEASGR